MSRMLDFKAKNRMRRALYAKPTIIALAVAFSFVAHSAWGMYQKSQEAMAKTNKVEDRLGELRAREEELSADIANLSTERGIEGEIRDRFMVAKEGESVMIVADPETEKVHTVTVNDDSPGIMKKMMSAVGLTD